MNYNEWMKEQYLAKMHKKTVTGRISSEKPMSAVEFIDLSTKSAKIVEMAENFDKFAKKEVNDAELARRTTLYGITKPAVSTPNPNLAFKRKKSVNDYEQSFYIPARHQNTYNDMRSDGVSKEQAQRIIKGFLMDEEKHPPKNHAPKKVWSEVPGRWKYEDEVIEVDTEAKPDRKSYNYLGIEPSAKKELIRSKVRSKIWNPKTEHWEDEERNEDPP